MTENKTAIPDQVPNLSAFSRNGKEE